MKAAMETQAGESATNEQPNKTNAVAEEESPSLSHEQVVKVEEDTPKPADDTPSSSQAQEHKQPQPMTAPSEETEEQKPPQHSAPLTVKKKRKKSRKIKRSENYPKFYRNAYVRYCEDARAKVCEENPSMDPVEITKLVAANWLSLDKELKQPFLNEAQLDKDRYDRELKLYQTLNKSEEEEGEEGNENGGEPLKKKSKLKKKRKTQAAQGSEPSSAAAENAQKVVEENQPSTSAAAAAAAVTRPAAGPASANRDEIPKAFLTSNCELPIFTDAFLEHNKIIETELKTLRRNNIEIEQQNSVLMKHIENMENGVRKVEAEIAENRQRNSQLEVYLIKLRVKLSAHFHSHSQPGWKNGATVETVDKYFQDLAMEAHKQSSSSSSSSPSSFISKARDILKKVDLKIN